MFKFFDILFYELNFKLLIEVIWKILKVVVKIFISVFSIRYLNLWNSKYL